MSIREVVEQDEIGALLAVESADAPTRLLVAKLAGAMERIVEGEPCSRVSEAALRTAVLICMAVCKPGHEPTMLRRAAFILNSLAERQTIRATATPAGAVMQ